MKVMSTGLQILLGALIGVSFSTILLASSNTTPAVQIGRYLNVPNKPQKAQQQLLQQNSQVHFPQSVLTLGQAIQFILQFSGYRLAPPHTMLPITQAMLKQPLPEIDRQFGPMPLQQALTTLAGKPFYLLIDPVHRLVSFRVKIRYSRIYQKNQMDKTNKIKKR